MSRWWWNTTARACKALESATCKAFGHVESRIAGSMNYWWWCSRCGRPLS